jgi:putative hydrolase
MGQVDPTNPESMQNIMAEGMFQPQDSPEQKAALARLETLLAMVEGWVEVVVIDAAGERLPTLPQLTEAMRRRRAAGGPAEKTFANLVGLELRPRRLREAAGYWNRVTEGDVPTRDNRWEHPDLLPTADDLDDLDGFFAGLDVPELEASAADLSELDEEVDDDNSETDSDEERDSNS